MTLALNPDVSAADTDTGMVLLDERAGRYWHLNDTGALVLRALLDGKTPKDAAARLAERSPGVGAERAAADVAALMETLSRSRLVRRA